MWIGSEGQRRAMPSLGDRQQQRSKLSRSPIERLTMASRPHVAFPAIFLSGDRPRQNRRACPLCIQPLHRAHRGCIWSGSATISVVIVAGIYPSVAVPGRVTVIVRVTEAANEDLAAVEPVSHHMPVDVGAAPGTRHGAESDGTRMNGAESPPGVAARKSAGKSAVASTEASATMAASPGASATMAASPSSKYGTRSQDQ